MKKATIAASLGAAIAIAACNTKDSASTSADSSAAVPPAVAAPAVNDNATIASYTLDMDKIQKLTAFMNNAAAYKKSHPGEDINVSMDASDNLETSIQKIEANPTARDLLQKSGLTARDYVLTISAYLGAGMTAAMLDTNPNAKIPEGVNPQNVEFIRTHKAELEQIKQALEENDR
jgi:ABC-type glycerol-3-phosphate transport system substrate-binding protein